MQSNAANKIRSAAEDLVRDRKNLVKGLLIVLILMIALILRLHENSKSDITIEDSSTPGGSTEICVDIGGAVVSPGVYNVDSGTRLYEVIDLAGGLLSNADTDSINRAEYVEDGEKIYIPSKAAVSADGSEQAASEEITQSDAAQGGNAADTASSGGLVNINSASKDELMTLKGIGEAKADSIIEYRSKTRFRSKEDIKDVDGIGDSIYNNIKDYIIV